MWKHLKIMKTDEYFQVWMAAVFYVLGTVYLVSVIYTSDLCLCAPHLKKCPNAGQSTAFATNPYRLFTKLYYVGYFPALLKTSVGPGVVQWLRRCATSRTVPGSIPGGVPADFFRGTPDITMCPEVDSASESGVKAAFAFGWRPTTLVVPKRQENPGP